MPHGKRLNNTEIDLINRFKKEKYNISQIARLINRSRKVIQNYLKDPENYRKKNCGGRPKAISDRAKRVILRIASNSALTAREIMTQAGVTTNIRNVQRLLKNSKRLKRKKLQRKPVLTNIHKEARLEFAQKHISWKKMWRKVIFSDEKKFNLDGPDGYQYYFHDLRKEPKFLSRRQMGGGSVMVWAAIGYHGKTDIVFLPGKLKSQDYIKIIDEQLTKYGNTIAGENYIFQQDNARVHVAKCVQKYFSDHDIKILNWPARSPDLNIIENCWSDLTRAVYNNGRQFQNVNDLKKCISEEWKQLNQENIKKIYQSLPERMVAVLMNKGQFTRY